MFFTGKLTIFQVNRKTKVSIRKYRYHKKVSILLPSLRSRRRTGYDLCITVECHAICIAFSLHGTYMYARSSVSCGYDQTFSNVRIDRTHQRGDLVTDNACGSPQTARTPALMQKVENKINKERRQMWDVANSVAVSRVTVHTILKHDFYMNKVSLHMLPLILMEEQKETCVRICVDLIKADAADDIFWEWS